MGMINKSFDWCQKSTNCIFCFKNKMKYFRIDIPIAPIVAGVRPSLSITYSANLNKNRSWI